MIDSAFRVFGRQWRFPDRELEPIHGRGRRLLPWAPSETTSGRADAPNLFAYSVRTAGVSCSGSTEMLTRSTLVRPSRSCKSFMTLEIRGHDRGQRVNMNAAIQTRSFRSASRDGAAGSLLKLKCAQRQVQRFPDHEPKPELWED